MGQSLVFARTQSWPYFSAVYGRVLSQLLSRPALLIIGTFVSLVIAVPLVRYFRRGGGRTPEVQQRVALVWHTGMRVLAVVLVLAALYAYFIRPRLADVGASWYYWFGDSQVPNVEPYNMIRLGWYLTPLGLILATAGTWLVLRHRVTPSIGLLMGVGIFFSVLFIANSRNNPHQIYVMRRYVPMVIPFLVTMAAYALDQLSRRGSRQRLASAVVTVLLAGWLFWTAWLEIVHVEYDGLIAQTDALAADLGSAPAIILFNDDLPVSTGALLGTPLNYLYGFSVFDLQEEYADPATLATQVDRWRAGGRRVLLAEGPDAVPDLFADLPQEPLADFRATYPVLEVSYEHKPQEVWEQTMDVDFFEVVGSP